VRVPFYYLCPAAGGVSFKLAVVSATPTPVPWALLATQIKPADIDDAAWPAILESLKRQLGVNWSDFIQALRDDAQYLADCGHPSYDGRELCMVEVQRASGGFSPRRTLAGGVDAFPQYSTSGLALRRIAPAAISQRGRSGPLGRGWWHQFEYSLAQPDGNLVEITGPGGSKRVFSRYNQSTWHDSLGRRGQLTELAGGGIEIREKTGERWTFNAVGQFTALTDPNGVGVSLTYTGGRLVKVTDTDGGYFTIAYTADGRISTLTDNATKRITYQYDTAGQCLVGVQYPDGTSVAYGNIAPTGTTSDYALNAITFADGTHRYYTYDAQGRLAGSSLDGGLQPV